MTISITPNTTNGPSGPLTAPFHLQSLLSGIDKLNQEQQRAALHQDGPLLILAGAGTGKTRTITYRVAYLIMQKRIPASSILAVTFTNKATQEMRERLHQLVPSHQISGITVSTFHSLGVGILRESIHHLGYRPQFTIYDSSDQLALVGEALRHYVSTKEDKNFDRKVIIAKMSWLKNQGTTATEWIHSDKFNPDDLYDQATAFVYQFYQEKMHFYNAIDFDDILFLTVKLLEEHPDMAKHYSERFKYILVDEYQDTNPLQLRLLMALTSTHNNICVVGDDDQAIYGFRGADIKNILEFERHFEGTVTIRLEENYRSVGPILSLANHVIKENRNRKGKTLWSQHKSDDIPTLWCCDSTESEAQLVVGKIGDLLSRGIKGTEIAIIYRSNTQAPPFEEILRLDGVNYKMIGGQKFYEKKEVKDLIAYLSLLQNPYDEISLRRILNVPARGIGAQTLAAFVSKAQENKSNLLETFFCHSELAGPRQHAVIEFKQLLGTLRKMFRELPLPNAITQMIEILHFPEYIEKTYKESKQVERRKNDLWQLVATSERFLKYLPPGVPPLKAFLEKLLLADQEDDKEKDKDKDNKDSIDENGENKEKENIPEPIWMMTLHSAKGLEFDHVFLVGLEEDLLPHKKSLIEHQGIEEERRLCYVGMTRARKELLMTYCEHRTLYGQEAPREKSRFLHIPVTTIASTMSANTNANTNANANGLTAEIDSITGKNKPLFQEMQAQSYLTQTTNRESYLKQLIEKLENKT